MGFLSNNVIRYVDRSYEQIKDRLLTQLFSRTPEITDHTESNIFVRMLSIWAGISEMLGYYIDSAARESFLDTCRRYESAVKIASQYDYAIHSSVASTVDIQFEISAAHNSAIIIPQGTRLKTSEGNTQFVTNAPVNIPAGELVCVVSAEQVSDTITKVLGNSLATASQSYMIGVNISDNSMVVRVNGVAWTRVKSLALATPTETQYVMTINTKGETIIRFGDGVNGKIPGIGQVIDCMYRETLGAYGNVDVRTIDTIVDSIALPTTINISCINYSRSSGGMGIEDIEHLRRRLPLALRTQYRAVTEQDYIDVAELYTGVARAGISFNCGKTVDLYIVPDGGGLASNSLITSVKNWVEWRKMITTRIRVFAAGEVRMSYELNIRVKPNYQNLAVKTLLLNRLLDFLSYKQQKIKSTVQLSDIYELIENTEGVENSDIVKMTSIPYARPVDTSVVALNWNRVVTSNSNSTIKWRILFISVTDYQLFKGNSFAGIHSIGVPVVQPEIIFTILSGAYNVGDAWEFYTYNSYGTLVLDEPSIPVSLAGDIIINAVGGL